MLLVDNKAVISSFFPEVNIESKILVAIVLSVLSRRTTDEGQDRQCHKRLPTYRHKKRKFPCDIDKSSACNIP